MKKYIFVVLLIIYNNSFAISVFLNCDSDLHNQGLSSQVVKAIENICSTKFMNYKAVFTLTPEYLPSSFYKNIFQDNFYIFDVVSDNIYLTFDKFITMLYPESYSANKANIIFGSGLGQAPKYPWLTNWFNETKSIGSVNALVGTNIEYLNYFYDGIHSDKHNTDSNNDDNYKHALIGVAVVGSVLLITTNLINYLYMKNYTSQQDRTPLLNSENNNTNINPI